MGHAQTANSALTLSPKVISVASLSKYHGAPRLRIGWVITRAAALRRKLVVAKRRRSHSRAEDAQGSGKFGGLK